MHGIKTADKHFIQHTKLPRLLSIRLHASILVLSVIAAIAASLTTVSADSPSLIFHYLPNSNPPCTAGAGHGGDIGVGVLNVHVITPPPTYTYYAFEAYDPNGVYVGQINWQVDPTGAVHNADAQHVVDRTVSGFPPSVAQGTWTFITPQSSDPNQIAGMSAQPLTVFYGTDCAGDVATLVNLPIDVYVGASAPTPTPTPGTNTKCNDDKSGGNEADCATCSRAAAPPSVGMATYSVHSLLVSLNIQDTPLHYTPAYGPAVDFTVTYNQKDSQQPAAFSYANLGPKWTFGWLSYVSDDPNSQLPQTSVYRSGGGAEIFAFNAATQSFTADAQSHAMLIKTGASTYERRMPDGSKDVFGLSNGATVYPRRVFLTQIVDPAGNTLNVGYDASFRVTTITDAIGQITTLSYDLAGDPLKITKVTDPFGRFATFSYTNGQLTTITDEIGIQSQLAYSPGTDFINSLTTPYGTTTFITGANGTNQWVEITDPLGGKERVEYRDNAPGISATEPVAPTATGITNAGLNVANTFYWDKKAMLVAPGDYTKAKIKHWLYNADGTVSGILSSEKNALENRVWYTYAGQPDYQHVGLSANPSQVARVLGDGSTQLHQYEYNSIGKTAKATDPVGRVMSYVYDTNNIDLLEIRQTTGTNNELQRKYTYNSLHEPLTDTDAAGQVTTYTYNTQGQVLTRKNAKNETTTYAYGGAVPTGCLASITSPPFNNVLAVTSFTYDSYKRVRTVTDSDNYTVTIDYDNLDRKTKVTYPDNTFEQFQYADNVTGAMTLDITGSRDRRGLWSYRHYNANRKMDSITDPANRTTEYGWCTCGALANITDPKNQTTTFNRDLQSRVYQKVFADGTTINYLYDGQTTPNTVGAGSRLKSSTDAKGQRTNYSYFADDTVQQITYTDGNGQQLTPPTPSVTFTYDPNYNRMKTMTDGTGSTVYAYKPIIVPPALGAGQLDNIDGPLANDTITFGYDELGRITSRSINGAANAASWVYDSLGRLGSNTNKLGTFNYSYVDVTDRLSSMTCPGGATAAYLYFPNAEDKHLQQIKNQTSTSILLSQFDYTNDVEGQILTWTKNSPNLATPQRYDLGYDNADQLLTAPLKNANTNALIKQYTYGYDPASNRTSERVANATTTSTPNNVNELVSQSGSTNRTLTYDLNGNLTNDGSSRTFEWDAANRLVAVNYTGTTTRSEFTYDGLSRVVKVLEKNGANTTSTIKFVWCEMEKCEERSAGNAVTLQTFPQGQYASNTAYFYTRDHLGSIREMFKSDGTVVARSDYDPWGRFTAVLNTVKPNFNYTGLYRHTASKLDFAAYRAYDPDLGRWLNRDPISERGGLNLYAYVLNSPGNFIDPNGLRTCWRWVHMTSFNNATGAYKQDARGRDLPLGPGDLAVGNYGAGPNIPQDGKLAPGASDQPAYPKGSLIKVYPSHSPAFTGRVSDWGSYNIKHPNTPTNGWIDIWRADGETRPKSDDGWISFEVPDCQACPAGSSG